MVNFSLHRLGWFQHNVALSDTLLTAGCHFGLHQMRLAVCGVELRQPSALLSGSPRLKGERSK